MEDLHAKPEDAPLLRELFERYAFKTWLRDVEKKLSGSKEAVEEAAFDLAGSPLPSTISSAYSVDVKKASAPTKALTQDVTDLQDAIERNYECVIDLEGLDKWLKKIENAQLVALDTETTGLDALAAELVGISLSVTPGEACYIPVAHRHGETQLNRD